MPLNQPACDFAESAFQDSGHRRRASDTPGAPAAAPSNADLLRAILEVRDRLVSIETAFPLNDINKPDFDGHRRDHVVRMKAAETFEGYKVEMTKKVLAGVVGLLFVVFSTGAGDHLKRLLGL